MAIAFDAFTAGGFSSSTTHTYSHTCTGSDRILFVHGYTNSNSDLITGITYNGVAMSFISKGSPSGGRYSYLYYLVAPATGANNVVITASSSTSLGGTSTSYTGASQSGQPDGTQSQLVTETNTDNTVVTTADNCWAVLTSIGAQATASTNTTLRGVGSTFGDAKMFDNNADITPAGSYAMATTSGGAGAIQYLQASFAPVFVPSGPANVKTYNGVASASTKTIDGVAIASVKTWNGIA